MPRQVGHISIFMEKQKDISVVILGYKAGDSLFSFHKKVVNALEEKNLSYEIIIVGNYRPESGDITPIVVKKISENNPNTLSIIEEKTDSKQAMGWDMRSGLRLAKGKTICVIDGDGQMPAKDIPLVYLKLINEKLDLCKTKRVFI